MLVPYRLGNCGERGIHRSFGITRHIGLLSCNHCPEARHSRCRFCYSLRRSEKEISRCGYQTKREGPVRSGRALAARSGYGSTTVGKPDEVMGACAGAADPQIAA
jgi:hypothetical protein